MRPVLFLVCLSAVPSTVLAQPSIAGTVRDASGSVLPGVVVQASSPALIEKSRDTITDDSGRYRLANLRPGSYVVTFSFSSWRPHREEGVEVRGSSTTTLNALLTLGGLGEVITVTAEPSAIDLQSTRREVTLSGELVKSIPTVRSYNAVVPLIPGVVTSSNDTVTATATTSFPIHGGRISEGRLTFNGLTIGSPPAGNSATSYVVDLGSAAEVTFMTAGGLGESETSGLVMNVVPQSGGNTTRASFFASGTGGGLQSDNLTPELRAQGLTATTPLTSVYDLSGTLGGALARDRAWYFVNGHIGGSRREVANVYYNLNAGDATQWLYSPDPGRREYSDRVFENASGRVTWQMTRRNRISGFWDAQALCRTCTGATPGAAEPSRVSPEAVGVLSRPLHVMQATWTAPVSNRLLLEAGFGGTYFGVGNFERDPNPTRDLVRVAEQCASGCAANGGIPGIVYRSQDYSVAYTGSYLWTGAVSFITGSHALKVGYQHTFMTDDRTWFTNTQNLTYRVSNGVPNQLTQSISPWVNNARAAWQALFAQEQWTRDRLTLQGAVRFDRAASWFPAQQEGPSRFLPAPIVIPESRGVDSYKDLTLRTGVAYDVAGSGSTVLKMTLGKYLEGAGVSGIYANTNPTLRLPQTTMAFGTAGVTRAWTDANRNFVPDCDLLNPSAQDFRASGGDLCGVMSNTNFGTNVLTNNFDPALLNGWGVRPSDWNLGVSLERQAGARSSFDIAFTRRWFHGFSVVDNLALSTADLTPFSLIAPHDPRLPDGGGYTISGLYDVVPDKAGQVDNLVTDSGRYGGWRQRFTGLDVTVNLRVPKRVTLVGGTSTGQTVADNCAVRRQLPELATTTTGTSPFGAGLATSAVTPLSPYCHVASGVLTQFRGLGVFFVPKSDLQLAATFQSKPGAMLAANYAATNAEIAPSLGRNLSGSAANATINLIAPGSRYGDRINQFDLRVALPLTFGRSRTMISLDIYNTLNSSAVLAYNTTFVPGGTWLQPLSVLTPRLIRFTAEIEF
jgi:hypothetical protein